MKRRLISWLLAIVMLLGLLPAMGLQAAAADVPKIVKDRLTTNMELQNDTIYLVTESYTIGGNIDENGLRVKAGANTVIYIAEGVTLTVNGGGSVDNTKGGKAGILLPASSTLTITGQGSLVVTGGAGAKADDGKQGTVGKMSQVDTEKGSDPTKGNGAFDQIITATFEGGNGGNGGHGASGGGAAIGTDGGVGGAGGAYEYLQAGEGSAQKFNGAKSKSTGIIYNNGDPIVAKAGANGAAGGTASAAGKLFVVGDVNVTATGGAGGDAGNAGAERTNVRESITFSDDAGSKLDLNQAKHHTGFLIRMEMGKTSDKDIKWATFCIGPGGPGGGGGAGGSGAAIGTGGTGGGGGAGGGGGGLSGTDKGGENEEADQAASTYGNDALEAGHGGGGGNINGAAGGSTKSGEFGLYKKGSNNWRYRLEAAKGGNGGAGGTNGTAVSERTDSYRVSNTAKVNGRNGQDDPETLKPPVAYHTFTVHKNNGTGLVFSANVVFGTTETTVLQIPTYTGYNFLGYFSNTSKRERLYDTGGNPTIYLQPFNSEELLKCTELTAHWKPITYTVEFYNADGSELLKGPETQEYGKNFNLYDHADRKAPDGTTFTGWSMWPCASSASHDAGVRVRNLSTTQGDVIKFYAVYQDIPSHTVTYDANGGTGAPAPGTVTDGKDYTISADSPTRDAYTFLGWADMATAADAQYKANAKLPAVKQDVKLYAVWKHNPRVTYDANGGQFTTSAPTDYPSPTQKYTFTEITPVREGYWFRGWQLGDKIWVRPFPQYEFDPANPYADITFKAAWEIETYALTWDEQADVKLNFENPTNATSGSKYEYKQQIVFGVENNSSTYQTVRVFINNVLLDPQADGKYRFTLTEDTHITTALSDGTNHFVSYDPNGGNNAPYDNVPHTSGATVTVKNASSMNRRGYTFDGWNTQKDGEGTRYAPGSTFTIDADVTLYAEWTPITYTVKYDANGGEGNVADTAATYDVPFAIPTGGFTKKDATFTGWAESQNGVVKYRGGEQVRNLTDLDDDEVTLYAVWGTAATFYTLTYNKNGGDKPAQSETAQHETHEPLMTNGGTSYTKDGYHIIGWNTAQDGSGTTYGLGVMIPSFDRDTTLYAVWEEDPDYSYTVRYDPNGGDGTATDQTLSVNDLSTPLYGLQNVSFTKEHATLIGWSTSKLGDTVYDLGAVLSRPLAEAGKTITLYAVWQAEDTYTVTYAPNGGTGTLPNDTKLYHQNDTVTVMLDPQPTRAGYSFLGWAAAANAQAADYDSEHRQFTMPAANVTLYAVWQRDAGTHTVTYDANGGTGDVPTDSKAYSAGDKVKVLFEPAPVMDGYSFLGWATSKTAAAADYTPRKNQFQMGKTSVTLYAVWHKIQQYTVTYHPNAGDDAVTGMPGNVTKQEDVPCDISIFEPQRDGYDFKGWSRTPTGAVEFRGGERYTANANLDLYAVWQRSGYTLTVDDGGVSAVKLTPQADADGKFPGDSTVRVTIKPADGHTLDELSAALNGAVMQLQKDAAGNTLSFSFAITCDSTLTVRAGAQTYTITYDPNGGDTPTQAEPVQYMSGVDLTLHSGAGFTKSGHHITAWNAKSDGSGTKYTLSEQLTAQNVNMTLYAVWEPDSTDPKGYSYTIVYNDTESSATATQTAYEKDTTLYTAADAQFTNDGYELTGWSKAINFAEATYAPGDRITAPLAGAGETVQLFTVWEEQTRRVKITLVDEQGVCEEDHIYRNYGQRYGKLPELEKAGYTFDGWALENGKIVTFKTRVKDRHDHKLIAQWTKDDNGNGGTSGGSGGSSRPGRHTADGGDYLDCPRDRTCPAYGFKDLDLDLWYHDGIHFCVEHDLMQGVSGGRFAPGGLTTRAQIVTILWRIEGAPEVDSAAFGDVHDSDWFAPAVKWAAANGIVVGYSDGRFGPNDSVTREQLAAILYRYAQYLESDVSAGEDTNILSYDDADRIGTWAFDAMQWACGSGIVGGTSARTLAPKATATRAQVAAMIMRFLALV